MSFEGLFECSEMEKQGKFHCLLVPFPGTGHVNPILQFAKRLQQRGIKVTLALTKFMHNSMHNISGKVAIETFSDGREDAGDDVDMGMYLARLEEIGTRTLTQLAENLRDSGTPVDCIVYDSFMNWALGVARRVDAAAAVFFSQSCAVNNVYYHFQKGVMEVPAPAAVGKFLIPGLPPLEVQELPTFKMVGSCYPPAVLEFFLHQFSNIDKADWIIFNSFYELEKEVLDSMGKKLRVWTVGPLVPSSYLDKRVEGDKAYGLNFLNPNTDTCKEWLDERKPKSVVYLSFGSRAQLGAEQIEELARGLKASNKYFLWVIRETEEAKLPRKFVEETSNRGLVVEWCPQLEVLAHEAIGCFVTHCGWNSTLEAISLGVPIVAMPEWADQVTNAKYSMDVWENGIKARMNLKGTVMGEEVQHCLKEVMEGQRGKDIRHNAKKWKDLAKSAIDVGGTSDRNIDHLVTAMVHITDAPPMLT